MNKIISRTVEAAVARQALQRLRPGSRPRWLSVESSTQHAPAQLGRQPGAVTSAGAVLITTLVASPEFAIDNDVRLCVPTISLAASHPLALDGFDDERSAHRPPLQRCKELAQHLMAKSLTVVHYQDKMTGVRSDAAAPDALPDIARTHPVQTPDTVGAIA
ncbi:MAG: hypothetical protein JWR21_4356 [Herminiimonas sp.]|nr:hypothetical protein [Herminiimonas sp.]